MPERFNESPDQLRDVVEQPPTTAEDEQALAAPDAASADQPAETPYFTASGSDIDQRPLAEGPVMVVEYVEAPERGQGAIEELIEAARQEAAAALDAQEERTQVGNMTIPASLKLPEKTAAEREREEEEQAAEENEGEEGKETEAAKDENEPQAKIAEEKPAEAVKAVDENAGEEKKPEDKPADEKKVEDKPADKPEEKSEEKPAVPEDKPEEKPAEAEKKVEDKPDKPPVAAAVETPPVDDEKKGKEEDKPDKVKPAEAKDVTPLPTDTEIEGMTQQADDAAEAYEDALQRYGAGHLTTAQAWERSQRADRVLDASVRSRLTEFSTTSVDSRQALLKLEKDYATVASTNIDSPEAQAAYSKLVTAEQTYKAEAAVAGNNAHPPIDGASPAVEAKRAQLLGRPEPGRFYEHVRRTAEQLVSSSRTDPANPVSLAAVHAVQQGLAQAYVESQGEGPSMGEVRELSWDAVPAHYYDPDTLAHIRITVNSLGENLGA